MSDDKKSNGHFPRAGTGEIEEWDDHFDDFHAPESSETAAPQEELSHLDSAPTVARQVAPDAPTSELDLFELGPAGGKAEEHAAIETVEFELGAAGKATPESAKRAVEALFAEAQDDEITSEPPARRKTAHVVRRSTADDESQASQFDAETRVVAIPQEQLRRLSTFEDDDQTVNVPLASAAVASAMGGDELFAPTETDVERAIDDLFGGDEDSLDDEVIELNTPKRSARLADTLDELAFEASVDEPAALDAPTADLDAPTTDFEQATADFEQATADFEQATADFDQPTSVFVAPVLDSPEAESDELSFDLPPIGPSTETAIEQEPRIELPPVQVAPTGAVKGKLPAPRMPKAPELVSVDGLGEPSGAVPGALDLEPVAGELPSPASARADSVDDITIDARSQLDELVAEAQASVGDETEADIAIGSVPAPGLDFDDDDEMSQLKTGVFSLELLAPDLDPELPPSTFADELPELMLDVAMFPEVAEPSLEDRSEALASDLLAVERELESVDEAGPAVRLRLEAARMAEELDDVERAQSHYRAAIEIDARAIDAVRGLRRLAAKLDDWEEFIALLEQEIALASPMERRALSAYRVDFLAARGTRDLAMQAVEELLSDAPSDARALLVKLELAIAENDAVTTSEALSTLARSIADPGLAASLRIAQAIAQPDAADEELLEPVAAQPDKRLAGAFLAVAAAEQRNDAVAVAASWLGAADGVGSARELSAALLYRAAGALRRAGDEQGRWQALHRAAELLPYDYPTQLSYAEASAAGADPSVAATAYQHLATIAPTDVERAHALTRAATLWSAAAPDDPDRARLASETALSCQRRVVALDPNDRRTAHAIEEAARRIGNSDLQNEIDRFIDETETDDSTTGSVYARVRIAHRLLALGKYDEAAADLVALRSAGAESPVLIRLLDRSLAYARRFDERSNLLGELADGNIWTAPEVALERAANAAEDAVNYRLLVEAEADAADAERRAAREAALLDALDEAIMRWRAVPADGGMPPSVGLALLSLSQRYAYRTGDVGALADVLQSCRESAATPARAVQLALKESAILLGQGEDDGVERAETCLREVRTLSPGDLRVSLARMMYSVAAGDWDDTADILVDTAEARGDGAVSDGMRYRAANILLDRLGDASRAADVVTPVVEHHPDFAAAQDLVRAANRQMGGTAILDPSLTVGTSAVDVRGDFGDAFAQHVREGELLEYRLGDFEKAVEVYRSALELRPGEPLVLAGLVRAARVGHRTDELLEVLKTELSAVDPEDSLAKARGFEAIAEVEMDLRGDPEAALRSLHAASNLEPEYFPVLRQLERRLGVAAKWPELYALYGRLISVLHPSTAAAQLAVERARLAVLAKESGRLADLYRAYEMAPDDRRVLAEIESELHFEAPSKRRSDIEVAVARYFADDPTAAYFMTLAGETELRQGFPTEAVQHFQEALNARPEHTPALEAWRRAAVASGAWPDVADTAVREAGRESDDEERVRLLHLAGVALMDKALDGERAANILHKVVELAPDHADAFARLRLLYDEMGRHEELVDLIEERIKVEDDLELRVELHKAAADLYRSFFDDRDRAVFHLRCILELVPGHRGAISEVADIAWEQGEWADAAEALAMRARIEEDPQILRNIFFRIGLIHCDRLPDTDLAIKSFKKVLSYDAEDLGALARLAELYSDTGAWDQALEASERLIKGETDGDAKIQHLHRAARIYVDGFQDRARAEKAIRIAIDVDPTSDAAISRMIEFYEGLGDLRGLRVNLDRVAAAMRSRLHAKPVDSIPYRVLARVFRRREDVGVRGSLATAFCAAELAKVLGGAGQAELELVELSKSFTPRFGDIGGSVLDDQLFPLALPPALREMFRLLGDRIAKHVGIDLSRYGVGRADRLANDDPVVKIVQGVATELRLGPVEVYVSESQPTVCIAEPTSPISVVLGKKLVDPSRPQQLRFLAGRVLKLVSAGLAVPSRMTARGFGLLTAALVRQFQPDFSAKGLDRSAVDEEMAKQKRLVPSAMRQALHPFAVGVAGSRFDYGKCWAAMTDVGNRAGLLVSGSAGAALVATCAMGGYRDFQSAARDDAIVHLLHFAVSEEYAALRATLDR